MSDRNGWRPLRRVFDPRPADVDEELAYHLEMRTEELMAEGRSREEAQTEALRAFGDLKRVRREVWRLDSRQLARTRWARGVDALRQDLRYGARLLGRAPGFTLVAVLSIALGIAGNATVFSLANAVLLRTPERVDVDGLVRVYRNHHSPQEYGDLAYFRERARGLSGLVGERQLPVGIRFGAEPERATAALVTEGYFGLLRVPMRLGRPFGGKDAWPPGSNSAVVLSHRYWLRHLAGDPGVVGRTVQLDGRPFTIVGVAAEGFRSSVLGWQPDLFVPAAEVATLRGESLEQLDWSFYTVARLAPGVPRARAQAELDGLMQRLAREAPDGHGHMRLRLDHMRGVNAEVRMPVAVASGFLMLVVLVVLMIACANVANLLLGRGAARRAEIAVRLAIGAGRTRLARQLLTESVLLALLGGAAGLLLSRVGLALIGRALPADVVEAVHLRPDAHVLLFTAGLSLLAAVAFGLVPALRASGLALAGTLRIDGGRGGTRRTRFGRGLIVAQVAGAMLLLGTAALFVRSLTAAGEIDPGFDPRGVLDLQMDLSLHPRPDPERLASFDRVVEQARDLPGVRAVALAALVPLSGSNMGTAIELPGGGAGLQAPGLQVYFNIVGPGYFETLRIPIARGRALDAADRRGAPLAAVVNEHVAQRLWPGADPIGRRFRFQGDSAGEYTVVGVARDARYNTPGEAPTPFVYLAFAQNPRDAMVLHVRAAGNVAATAAALRRLLPAMDPALPPGEVSTMAEDMEIMLLPARGGAALLAVFGAIALLLAATGIFGVTSYAVAQRTREMGVRAALGATPRALLRLVVGDSLRTVAVGLALGLFLAVGAGFALTKLLYGVTPLHPVTLLAMPAVLAATALLASWWPARRAARASPTVAMRAE